jgi:hypothetical protein
MAAFSTLLAFSTMLLLLRRPLSSVKGPSLFPPLPSLSPILTFPPPLSSSWNLKDSKFLVPGKPLEHWSVAVFASQNEAPLPVLQAFFASLANQARLRGSLSSSLSLLRPTLTPLLLVTGMPFRTPLPKFVYQQSFGEDPITTLKSAANLVLLDVRISSL